MTKSITWGIILEKHNLLGEGERWRKEEKKLHDSDNKALIAALFGVWIKKQRFRELSLEHVLE